MLKPLCDAAVAQVIGNLLGSAGLPESFIKRVVVAAEGSPLYVEQMLSMLVDSGVVKQEDGKWVAAMTDGEISIPPTFMPCSRPTSTSSIAASGRPQSPLP